MATTVKSAYGASLEVIQAIADRPEGRGAYQEAGHWARVGWVEFVATVGPAHRRHGLSCGNCANCGNPLGGIGSRSFRSFRRGIHK